MADYKLESYNGIPDSGGDCTSAWNSVMAVATRTDYLVLNPGTYHFKSQINPLKCNIRVSGNYSVLSKDYTGDFIIVDPGVNFLTIAGYLYLNNTVAGGIALKLYATAGSAPDQAVISNLYITGPANWNYCLFFDGSARTSPRGIRGAKLTNIHCLSASTAHVYLKSVVNLCADNVNGFPSNGSANQSIITGISGVESVNIHWTAVYLDKVTVSYASQIKLNTMAGGGSPNKGKTTVTKGTAVTNLWIQ